jgi:hypothetical protein
MMIYGQLRFCLDFVVVLLLPMLMGLQSKGPTAEEFIPGQNNVNIYAIIASPVVTPPSFAHRVGLYSVLFNRDKFFFQ